MTPNAGVGKIRLEIDASVLERLLRNSQIYGEEIRCLDNQSKRCVWRMILTACSRITNHDLDCDGNCNQCGAALYLPLKNPLPLKKRHGQGADSE